jgi:hypothetical protein
MNWNHWIRKFHRWLSIAFTLTVMRTSLPSHRREEACLRLDHLLATAAAGLADVHRPVLIRAALCRQDAQPATATKGIR